jgi:LPXTG-site transpeptidase (sortase) family protein
VATATSTAVKVHPVAIRIPAIQVSSRDVVPVGLNPDRTMAVPPLNKVGELGWYKYAPVPGDTGPAVVVAHVDQNGHQGLFAKLSQLQSGDVVEIDRSDGQTATFRVNSNTNFPKTEFPSSIYNNTPDSELNLITCTGTVDKVHHRYLSQDVVNAVLISLRPTVE